MHKEREYKVFRLFLKSPYPGPWEPILSLGNQTRYFTLYVEFFSTTLCAQSSTVFSIFLQSIFLRRFATNSGKARKCELSL